MNYWLFLEKSDDTRVHNGIDSYKDETGKTYNYDSFVPNYLNIKQGDRAILRVENDIIGIGVIGNITKKEILKIHRRCPKCDKTNIRERKTKIPSFRCNKCKDEFLEPNTTKDPADAFTAEIINFVKFTLPPSVSDVKKCSITSGGQKNQLAMMQLDPEMILKIITLSK